MNLKHSNSTTTVNLRDRIPVLTKISYGLGTGLDMWGL